MSQLAPSKVLAINLVSAEPAEIYGVEPFPNQAWRFNAVFDIIPQIHSDMRTPTPGVYDGLDVNVGEFIGTQAGRILEIISITVKTRERIECILEDTDRLNSSIDSAQAGESVIQLGTGLLFTVRKGVPVLYPLPGSTGQISASGLVEIISRFFYSDGTPADSINSLSDVDLTDLRDGAVLVYKADTAKWRATDTLEQQIVEGGHF